MGYRISSVSQTRAEAAPRWIRAERLLRRIGSASQPFGQHRSLERARIGNFSADYFAQLFGETMADKRAGGIRRSRGRYRPNFRCGIAPADRHLSPAAG